MNKPTSRSVPHMARQLTREDLAIGSRRDAYLRTELADIAWSEARLQASLEETLARGPKGDIWVFAYGSLIWHPLFPVAEKRVARIYGLHRSFCLWSYIGRGTRQQPGLVLGLDLGGACRGLALRMEESGAREELTLLWRREMLTGAYVPTWVNARTPDGPVDALAFLVNRKGRNYAGQILDAEAARIIGAAAGLNGPCRDYLVRTAEGLAAHGFRDARLERLVRLCDSGG